MARISATRIGKVGSADLAGHLAGEVVVLLVHRNGEGRLDRADGEVAEQCVVGGRHRAAAAAGEPGLYRLAADRTGRAAERFTLDRAAERLHGCPPPPYAGGSGGSSPRASTARRRVVVAGHDLKFFTPLLSYLRLQPDLEVRLDQWAALG